MLLQTDTLFDRRYRLQKQIGSGGFSEVWKAFDTMLEEDIVIKVYSGIDEHGLEAFRNELAVSFKFKHTNILKPLYLGICDKMVYLTMPYCKKGSVTKKMGQMTEYELRKLIKDVSSGLAYLHKQGIVQQDIKPDNILIDDDGNYVITDFGISTKAQSTDKVASAGTRAYMGPERFGKDATPIFASDIWSLGATVYELMTKKCPFGETGGIMQASGAEIPPITSGEYSERLKSMVYKMLSPKPWDRDSASVISEKNWNKPWIVSGIVACIIIFISVVGHFVNIAPTTIVVQDTLKCFPSGTYVDIPVTSNSNDWNIQSLPDWIIIGQVKQHQQSNQVLATDTCVLIVRQNFTNKKREGDVVFRSTKNVFNHAMDTIHVVQY